MHTIRVTSVTEDLVPPSPSEPSLTFDLDDITATKTVPAAGVLAYQPPIKHVSTIKRGSFKYDRNWVTGESEISLL